VGAGLPGYFFLNVVSSETVNFFLPFFLREANTLRPLALAMRSRKPCLFFLFLFDGWNVRFIACQLRGAKIMKISGFTTRTAELDR
jgi:hypothetical protein